MIKYEMVTWKRLNRHFSKNWRKPRPLQANRFDSEELQYYSIPSKYTHHFVTLCNSYEITGSKIYIYVATSATIVYRMFRFEKWSKLQSRLNLLFCSWWYTNIHVLLRNFDGVSKCLHDAKRHKIKYGHLRSPESGVAIVLFRQSWRLILDRCVMQANSFFFVL